MAAHSMMVCVSTLTLLGGRVVSGAPASRTGSMNPTAVAGPLASLWVGVISFDEGSLQTEDAALNVTLTRTKATTQTAAFRWAFTRDSAGTPCVLQFEPTLTWSANATDAIAEGTGANPDFYSFQGKIDPASGWINGTVYHPPFSARVRAGSFAIHPVTPTTPAVPSHCIPHPVPPSPSPGAQNPPIWPAPAEFVAAAPSVGVQAILDASALTLVCNGPQGACDSDATGSVPAAFARGKAWAFMVPTADRTGATLTTVIVTVAAVSSLQFGVNESYTLAVNVTHAVITAPTQWGALYGLESFFQLVLIEPWEVCPVCNKYVLRVDVPFTIHDTPRVQWRGLMIDTGRHYLPPVVIKRAIDAMAASKLNALHWHLTDDQSFPVCLDAQPDLCRLSQYHDHVTGAPQNYTSAVIRDIVEYATDRGVRIMPELDLPGHSVGLQRGAPALYTNCTSTHKLPDPTTDDFFQLIDSIVGELAILFPDRYFHMGGDEVDTSCWTENPAVVKWMAGKNLTAMGTLGYFQSRIQSIVASHGKASMFWDEFWVANLAALNSTVAEIRSTAFAETLASGRKALTAGINEAWYLDHGIANPRFIQSDWEPYYLHDPFDGLSGIELENVLGGEVDMWGEGVDETNFEPRVFPWASAVAERLWSPADRSGSTVEAEPRLDGFRCLLVRRGIRAAPIGPGAPC